MRARILFAAAAVALATATVAACSRSSDEASFDAGAPEAAAPLVDASLDADASADAGPAPATCPANTNLQTDFKNCGRCGHDCRGGACTAGICQPYRITNTPSGARELLYVPAKSGTLYFTNGIGEVRAQPIGDETVRLLATGQGDIRRLATDGVSLYWATPANGTISRCDLLGCEMAPQVIASAQPSPFGVAYDAVHQRIVWANRVASSCDAPDAPVPGDIRSAQIDGGDLRVLVGDAGAFPSNIAATGSAIYWTLDRCSADAPEGTLLSLATNGTRSVLASASGDEVLDLTADDAGAAIALSDGGVFTAPPSTQRDTAAPLRTALDATYIYWTTDYGLHWVKRSAPSGSPPEGSIVFTEKLNGPIVVGDPFLYFSQGISIFTVAKP